MLSADVISNKFSIRNNTHNFTSHKTRAEYTQITSFIAQTIDYKILGKSLFFRHYQMPMSKLFFQPFSLRNRVKKNNDEVYWR
jgi:hypothetical protein